MVMIKTNYALLVLAVHPLPNRKVVFFFVFCVGIISQIILLPNRKVVFFLFFVCTSVFSRTARFTRYIFFVFCMVPQSVSIIPNCHVCFLYGTSVTQLSLLDTPAPTFFFPTGVRWGTTEVPSWYDKGNENITPPATWERLGSDLGATWERLGKRCRTVFLVLQLREKNTKSL